VFIEEDDEDDEGEDKGTEAGDLPKLKNFCLWGVAWVIVIGSGEVSNGMCIGKEGVVGKVLMLQAPGCKKRELKGVVKESRFGGKDKVFI
jgi:hypothetical protein